VPCRLTCADGEADRLGGARFDVEAGAAADPRRSPRARHGPVRLGLARRGRPLDCTRSEFEERVRGLLFSVPRYPPNTAREEPTPQLVEELAAHGIDSAMESLSSLPFTVVLEDAIAQHLQRS
jgi:hypothetical protein